MKKLALIFSIIFLSNFLFAQTETINLSFSLDDFTFTKEDIYDIINPLLNSDYIFTHTQGRPQLPMKIITLSLPQDKKLGDIKVIHVESQRMEGYYNIYPAQKPKVLSDDSAVKFIPVDPAIYDKSGFYPREIVQNEGSGFLSGYHLGSLTISPFQYDPVTKELVFIKEIEIEYEYSDISDINDGRIEINNRSIAAQKYLKDEITALVFNKNIIYHPEVLNAESKDEIHEYVIITNDAFVDQFQPLADWKTQKGIKALVVSTSDIFNNYDGIDNAEKVRNFIKDYYQNHGTLWVLLGGDTDYVPYRVAFAFDCEYGAYSNNFLPCDLYFSDLDGTWNDNGNDIWGELEDNVDMYPDVFVGRASVETIYEATTFVNKVLTYEKTPPTDYQTDMLFLAQVLWDDPYTDSGVSKNFIDNSYVPNQFDQIVKLYESLGNNTYDNAMLNLNAGKHIINHCGHAGKTSMSLGNAHLRNGDMDNLANGPAFSILYTIGCWPAAFDYDCIAEHWINNPFGGGVAFIGNSRYGWGSPGNPLYGYSDSFDQEFYRQLFIEDIYSIGMTMALTKSVYVPYSRNENVFRWCEYEINLLGEPEMHIWTDLPQNLFVSHPDSVTVGTSKVQVSVSDGEGPLQGVLVCLMQGEEVYETGYTNHQGEVQLIITTESILNDLTLTVTAHNCLPYQDTIKVISDEPYVSIGSYTTNSSVKGYVIPGTTVSIDADFHNFGEMPTDDIECIVSSTSDLITLIDSIHTIAHINPQTTLFQENAFSFDVSPQVKNGEVISLPYTITDDSDAQWEGTISITGAIPIFEYIYHSVDDSVNGNGNGIPEPGEEINIQIIIRNKGLLESNDTHLTLSSDSPCVDIPYCMWDVRDVLAGQCTECTVTIMINNSCIPPAFADIELICRDSLGYTCIDTFTLTIGETGFTDDVESGDSKWTHWGTDDLWHLTNRKSVSGNYSWYCGIEDSVYYPDNVTETLESIPFTIGTSPTLSFWSWNEFTNYGVDGFYVEIYNGTEWDTLDFIGSGGALSVLTTKNGWLEYEYDLSAISPGTESRIRFNFISDDEDVAEGVYIDDIVVFMDNCPIYVDFIADIFYGEDPESVQFSDLSYAETGLITNWEWDFGDGNSSDEMNPQNTYNEDGMYTVTLEVTDQFGISASKRKADYIHILPETTKTVYVNQDGSGDFTTLSEAFNVLSAGDSVIVADGIYDGNMNTKLLIPKNNITICSENGYEDCIIDGGDLNCAFMCGFTNDITFAGLTFSSCRRNDYGGAVSTNRSATFLNCYFVDCFSSSEGGAIWAADGEFINIEDCLFENCEASEGGAAYIDLVEEVMIKNSELKECQATISGGGIYSDGCHDVLVDSCSFMYNGSTSGGAMMLNNSSVDITHCEFGFNNATEGSGCYIRKNSVVIIDNSLFYENSSDAANSKGGALYVNDCVTSVINSTIADNSMSTEGGGVSHLGSHVMSIYNSILWNNIPSDIWAADSTKINISFSDVTNPWTGQGNISQNPIFKGASTQVYCLAELSPCIDVGNNNYVHAFSDIKGNVRIWDGSGIGEAIVDMGCYEYGAPIYSIEEEVPEAYSVSLIKNYPNPFAHETQIKFYVRTSCKCTIDIYNIKGQKVKNLVQEDMQPGFHSVQWNGMDNQNRKVANGIYFYVLKTNEQREVKKLVLMR